MALKGITVEIEGQNCIPNSEKNLPLPRGSGYCWANLKFRCYGTPGSCQKRLRSSTKNWTDWKEQQFVLGEYCNVILENQEFCFITAKWLSQRNIFRTKFQNVKYKLVLITRILWQVLWASWRRGSNLWTWMQSLASQCQSWLCHPADPCGQGRCHTVPFSWHSCG